MLDLLNVTIKNFLSIGNVTQAISFQDQSLVLVLGDNLDLGGNDNRNGAGKSAIVNAIFYAFFGEALTKIRKDNLVNKVNSKDMLVTVEFAVRGTTYRIERGRKPNVCRLFSNGDVMSGEDSNDSLGESRYTQSKINELIGMSRDLMKQICLLNTHTDPFLALPNPTQTAIIEQLFGITALSEKAAILADDIRTIKTSIKEENIQIAATIAANDRISANIKSTEFKGSAWDTSHNDNISKYSMAIESLLEVNIEDELAAHEANSAREVIRKQRLTLTAEADRIQKEIKPLKQRESMLGKRLMDTDKVGICPVCEQEMDHDTHAKVQLDTAADRTVVTIDIMDKKDTLAQIEAGLKALILPKKIKTFYSNVAATYDHKSQINVLGSQLEEESKRVNPYVDQIADLREHGLKAIDRTDLEELISTRDHSEFLYKLLTSKESFIRKRIIEHNVSALNIRLQHYISSMGLQHSVTFKPDLSAEIALLGNYFDFDNLSRGEKTRLTLALSWAFRDCWEAAYGRISILWIDELLDAGLDASGVDCAMAILKKMARNEKRNIFLISHKEELIGRVSTVLTVTKTNGFSVFSETTN